VIEINPNPLMPFLSILLEIGELLARPELEHLHKVVQYDILNQREFN